VTLSHDKEVPESRQSYLALLQRLFTLTDVDVRRKTNEHTCEPNSDTKRQGDKALGGQSWTFNLFGDHSEYQGRRARYPVCRSVLPIGTKIGESDDRNRDVLTTIDK
jgi:hypothetical protein